MNADFCTLVDHAMQLPGRTAMRPVIEKELLHYDIFHAMDKAGLLKNVVFQGGTSLRLCRGSSRFSEDLDFAGGRNFKTSMLYDIADAIKDRLQNKYGLTVSVSEPSADTGSGVEVKTWQVSVITAPERRDIPRQRIKIEVVNVPAYTSELLPIKTNYDFLSGLNDPVLVNVESLDEIMADKLIAFPVSPYVRWRDIWDLAWLSQQNAKLVPRLVELKIDDYAITDYQQKLETAINLLPDRIHDKRFMEQMVRFIDSETVSKTLRDARFLDYLENAVGSLLADLENNLFGEVGDTPEFKM